MLHCVALVITGVSVELRSFIRVTNHPDDGTAKFLRNVVSYKNHAT
jgi:hypothetical protein